MSKMRVVQVTQPNGPFELVEREIPEPAAGWVRIKVEACGICHSDSLTKEGIFPGIQYPRVPGHEVAIARGSDKEPLARQLGAHHYIDSQAQDVAAELLKMGGAKVILATVTNAQAMSATLGGLGINGKLLVLGAPHEALEVRGVRPDKGTHSPSRHRLSRCGFLNMAVGPTFTRCRRDWSACPP
jgi:D-arabinose 1-dehydrogenase-like Zn-dependent alcohol dehydrogenase